MLQVSKAESQVRLFLAFLARFSQEPPVHLHSTPIDGCSTDGQPKLLAEKSAGGLHEREGHGTNRGKVAGGALDHVKDESVPDIVDQFEEDLRRDELQDVTARNGDRDKGNHDDRANGESRENGGNEEKGEKGDHERVALQVDFPSKPINLQVLRDIGSTLPSFAYQPVSADGAQKSEADELDELAEDLVETNPKDVKVWLSCISDNHRAPQHKRLIVLTRALQWCPRSYKISLAFFHLAELLLSRLSHQTLLREAFCNYVELVYKRSRVYLPTVWKLRVRFAKFLFDFRREVTRTRLEYNDILRALPVSQHTHVWPAFLDFAQRSRCPSTEIAVRRRHSLFAPSAAGTLALSQLLADQACYDEAALKLSQATVGAFADSTTASHVRAIQEQGSSSFQPELTAALCSLLAEYGAQITSVDGCEIFADFLQREIDLAAAGQASTSTATQSHTRAPHGLKAVDRVSALGGSSQGVYWIALATYFAGKGEHQVVVFLFEKAFTTIVDCGDFADIYRAFSEYLLRRLGEGGADAAFAEHKLEKLTENRVHLLGAVRTRATPNHIPEWLSRIDSLTKNISFSRRDPYSNLQENEEKANQRGETQKRSCKLERQINQVVALFEEALQTVDVLKATGGLTSALWSKYAEFHLRLSDLEAARHVFERACSAPHRFTSSLVGLHCQRIETELCHNNNERALELARRAVSRPQHQNRNYPRESGKEGVVPDEAPSAYSPQSPLMKHAVHRSLKLWNLFLDLELSFGSLASVRGAFDRSIDSGGATVAQVLALCERLRSEKYYEASYRAYEKAIRFFPRDEGGDRLWLSYLSHYVSRHKGTKLDRARDLFDQAISGGATGGGGGDATGVVSAEHCFSFHYLYAKFEEEFGSVEASLRIFDAAVTKVPACHRLQALKILVAQTALYKGLAATRDIFERGLKLLQEDLEHADLESVSVSGICHFGLRFAEAEIALLEYERARAIFEYVAQYADPAPRAEEAATPADGADGGVDGEVAAVALWKAWKRFEGKHGNEATMRDMVRKRGAVKRTFEDRRVGRYDAEELRRLEAAAEKQLLQDLREDDSDSSVST